LRVKLAADQKARDWDLLDFVDMMLAIGKRISENSAISWHALDLDAGTVEIRGTVVRIKGQGVTSHVFRKTVATLLDEAGVSARKIADQLGRSQVSVTQDFYMGRKIASDKAARVLEIIGRPHQADVMMPVDDGM
jgi:integrase